MRKKLFTPIAVLAMAGCASSVLCATERAPAEKIIIDTDIGSDIDDAFAVALALRSPEFTILGITTASGDTRARARILDRMLGEAGRQDIPVAAGGVTSLLEGATVDQHAYGEAGRFKQATHQPAVDFVLEQILRSPGEITLVAIGPVSNLGAMIDKDPQTFRKLKRVVLMGGWINAAKPEYGHAPAVEVIPEYNIRQDIGAAQKLFQSGVMLYVMPFDATSQLALDEVKRNAIFAQSTPLTDSLTLQYHAWSWGVTPVLYDAMTLAWMLDPKLCPVQPMRVTVDDKGYTRLTTGAPNAQVCLNSDVDAFFRLFMHRILAP